MQNELALMKNDFKGRENSSNLIIKNILRIANDSLFFFGIFLSAAFLMNYIAVILGFNSLYVIGIKEVLVSGLGFFNIFFTKTFLRYLGQ